MNNFSKKMMVVLLCLLLVCGMQASAACTAVYVGHDVSADGSSIIARTNDCKGVYPNHLLVTPRVENQAGRYMPVSNDGKVKTEIPATTYKYTSTPLMNSSKAKEAIGNDAAACTNEYGVAMTMSVTAFVNDDAMKADPLIEEGITEYTAVDLVVCQSKTAREAVEVLGKLIDKYGSSETNIALIADQNEVWYVEMYTGHQYAAVKLPSDKVAAFGNEFNLEYMSDYEDNITSKDLIKIAEENGFAVHGKNNEINLYDTYSGSDIAFDYSHRRTWYGHQLLSPSNFSADYDLKTMYPLCFSPDKNVSVEDVCQITRSRYEGTEYSPDETGREDIRVIGSDTTQNAHVLQVFPDLPAEMSCVSWLSVGPQIYGVYVPLSNDCINISESYGANQAISEAGNYDTSYPYFIFKDLCTRCVGPDNYDTYGKAVKAYWNESEINMFAGMSKVLQNAKEIEDKDARAEYITSYCNQMQTYAYEDGKEILNNVTWEQSKNSNTLKVEMNPETHELTGEKTVNPPMNISLNASKYKYVPEKQEGGFSFKLPFT